MLKNAAFFSQECKRSQRTLRSFVKKIKQRKDRSVILKRTEKNARTDAQPCMIYLYFLVFLTIYSKAIMQKEAVLYK